nr:transcription termination/antitermination NusG family protein [Rhizobium sp. BK538]
MSLIERNLANAGFESFMPTYRIVVKHHRNKKLIERRFPIFTGYVFVNLPTQRFVPVEAVEGVGKLLKYSRIYGDAPEPFSFPQEVIDRLRYMVWEEDQKFLLDKAWRMRQEEVDRELVEVKKAASRASRKIRNAQYSELAGGLAPAALRRLHPALWLCKRWISC